MLRSQRSYQVLGIVSVALVVYLCIVLMYAVLPNRVTYTITEHADIIYSRVFKANPTEAPAFKTDPTEAPAFKTDPTEAPAFKTDPTEAPAFKTDLTEAPAFKADPTEAPAFKADPTEAPAFKANLTNTPAFKANLTETLASEANFKETPEESKLKVVLQWNPDFAVVGEGQAAFYKLDCEYKNCFVTDNRTFLEDITKFDAITFSGRYLPRATDLPKQRLETQKYIFGATESAHNYPVCDPVYDGFFNWTWAYRLDSDFRWGYITIYDLEGRKVGPKTDMKWPELAPVSDEFKKKLESKNKVVAWFVSNCHSMSHREKFVDTLRHEAKTKYGWNVDVYGRCGNLRCPRDRSSECFNILKRDYYFYLSFENSFAQDYVTEKLLNALNNDAVPIVFGSANYSRFLPPGSYLDARELGPIKLAETMDEIYKNKTRYYEFFRWKNHFRYKETYEADVCNLCAALNDKEAVRRHSVYKDFRGWWNAENTCS